jgi:predicted Holliday junction resolvase-like endonuclease
MPLTDSLASLSDAAASPVQAGESGVVILRTTEILMFLLPGILLLILLAVAIYRIARIIARHEFEKEIQKIRQDAVTRSRSVLTGNAAEQLAPWFPGFPFHPADARFVGRPVDFIVFNGSQNQRIEEVVFVEVKTGKSGLNPNEKSLRECIRQKKVRWLELRIHS